MRQLYYMMIDLKKVDKWYNKPWVGFILGCATITTSSWIVKNVID